MFLLLITPKLNARLYLQTADDKGCFIVFERIRANNEP